MKGKQVSRERLTESRKYWVECAMFQSKVHEYKNGKLYDETGAYFLLDNDLKIYEWNEIIKFNPLDLPPARPPKSTYYLGYILSSNGSCIIINKKTGDDITVVKTITIGEGMINLTELMRGE